jgi:hypothetical protein
MRQGIVPGAATSTFTRPFHATSTFDGRAN